MTKKSDVKSDKSPEEKKEWKPSGRILSGKELEDYNNSFLGIEDSIAALCKKKK